MNSILHTDTSWIVDLTPFGAHVPLIIRNLLHQIFNGGCGLQIMLVKIVWRSENETYMGKRLYSVILVHKPLLSIYRLQITHTLLRVHPF